MYDEIISNFSAIPLCCPHYYHFNVLKKFTERNESAEMKSEAMADRLLAPLIFSGFLCCLWMRYVASQRFKNERLKLAAVCKHICRDE